MTGGHGPPYPVSHMELERVQLTLRAASLCLQEWLFDSAANRAYFAAFQAAICALGS